VVLPVDVRFSGVVGLLCLVFILVLNSTSVFNVVSEYSSWTFLSEYISQRVVLYDEDLNGEPEILVADNLYYYNLMKNASRIEEIYPFKLDFNATGVICLGLYNAGVGMLDINCHGLRPTPLQVLRSANVEVYRWGVVFYNTTHRGVVVAGKFYEIPVDLNGAPVVVNNKPLIIGTRGEGTVIYDLELRNKTTITTSNIVVLEALYDEFKDSIFGVGLLGEVLHYIEYNVTTGSSRIKPLDISPVQVIATTSRIYVLDTSGVLHVITSSGETLSVVENIVKLYYPADSVDSFTALTASSVLKIVETESEIYEYPLPPVPVSDIYAVDWWGSILAVATSSGVYVATTKPVYVFIRAPVSVYAGEFFRVEVSGVYDSVVVNINGRVYYGSATLRLPPGNFTVTARACRGVFCVENTTSILVLRRPLEVRVEYPSVTKPYDSLTVFVETIDKLTNTSVVVSCTISDPRGRVHRVFTSSRNITVPAIPDVDSSVFTVTCGGGNYEIVSVTVRSKLTEPYLKIKFNYYGSGLLEISGYDVYTGEDWDGLVVVEYLDLDIVVTGERSALVTLPPGSTRLNISLVKNNITYYTEEVTVVYYEDVFMVPAGMPVIVGDRVKVDVYTLTETITRPFPVYYEIRVVDPLIVAATAAFTAGAVYAILMILGRLPRIKRGE